MDLVGAWLRQLLRAGTVAALVPIAIVASLAVVLTGAGGVGGLDSLGQLVTGPEISPAQRAIAATPSDRGDTQREVALVAPAALDDAALPGAQPGSGEAAPPPARSTPPPPRRVVPLTPPEVLPPQPPATPPPAAPATPPAPPPAAPPTARERTGKVVEELGESVDDVVGVVEEVIGGLGRTLGGILDGPPPRR